MKAFEEIYNLYHKDVYNFILKLSGYQTDISEELLQETFYQAYISLHRFRGGCEMKTWLCQIAKNTYYSFIRSKVKQNKIIAAFSVREVYDDIADSLERKDQFLHIKTVIESLDEMSRSIVQYRLYSELSYKEIASLLHMKETTAKVTYYRAKVRIQQLLKEVYGYEI